MARAPKKAPFLNGTCSNTLAVPMRKERTNVYLCASDSDAVDVEGTIATERDRAIFL